MNPEQIGEGELTPEQQLYKEHIIDHYRHPRNKRVLKEGLQAKEVNPLCGDRIEVYVILKEGRVDEITFEGSGCAISQAAMSMLTEELKGKSTTDVARMTREDILQLLNIPIGAVRMKCAMLGLRTTQKAIGSEQS